MIEEERAGYVSFIEITITDDSLPASEMLSLAQYAFAVDMLFAHETLIS